MQRMEKNRTPDMLGPPCSGGQVAAVTGPDHGLLRWRCVHRWIPAAYREELQQLLRLTGPLLASRILNFLLPFINAIFCGHLGNSELAGYALASATINVTSTAVGYGLALACDTLVSQTFGGKNLKRVGEILQRSILILLLFCLPCWAVLVNTQSILIALQQEAEVARIAQLYVNAFLPAVPAMFLHQLQVAYLQNQGITLPQLYVAALANVINISANYILLFWMELGVKGSAIANSLSQIYSAILLLFYIRWKKLHVKTWGGWSLASLQEWGSYMQLAIPSTLMLCFEWWIYEIGGFLAGMLGEVDLAAQHVLLELGAITYMFPLGIHAAACVRVGNALGAGDTASALTTSKVSLVLSGVLAVFQGIVLGSTKTVVGFIFTSDVNIVKEVSRTLNVYIFLQFFDALVCVSSGILLGAGKQKIAAVANLICYYTVGVPTGISLMFAAKLRISGLWLGLLICVVIQAFFFITLIFKMNWIRVTEEAQKRAAKGGRITCVGPRPPIGGEPVIDTLVPENSDGPKEPVETVLLSTENEDGKTRDYPFSCNKEQHKEPQADPEAPRDPKPPLSIPQLLLRRGMALLAAILTLAAGIIAHFTFPPPDLRNTGNNYTLVWGNFSTSTLTPLINTTRPA
ncbi:multidrug and toxin extrusion protein 1 [Scleropages formosus]|uniref:Multidrug and toxin extrusion protein n=1 Tax=Scleropages formosus TaxID=113540 RepID=A0A8C9U2H4_SCLFO|nr:multidrug and toxin extrusion protein 1-like [Scleropages formosus]XP_018586095.1 multidrug and toxin extrusion protein 1-like [Scleropages formosus]